MKSLDKLWIFGLVFILMLSATPLKANNQGTTNFKIRPVRLEILSDGSDTEQDLNDWMYAQGGPGIVIVFGAMFGFENKQGVVTFPRFRASLKNSNKFMFYIDFKVSKNSTLSIAPFISGPVAGIIDEDKDFVIKAKANIYYRQVFEIDLTTLAPNSIFPGLYDLTFFVFPTENFSPMRKTGGMTSASCRLWLVQ